MAKVILVVDDNAMNTKLMTILLESAGFQVDAAANAREARVAVDRRRPDLVLMDLQMPEVDGYTLTAEFRKRPDLKTVPILAVTAAAMRGDEQRALTSGCDGYITKPIDTRAFAARVAGFLSAAPA